MPSPCHTRAAFGAQLNLNFGCRAQPTGFRSNTAGHLYLGTRTYARDQVPDYGYVRFSTDGKDLQSRRVPAPIYLSEILRTDERDVWIHGAVEVKDREREVLLPVEADHVPRSRQRFAASEETILLAREGRFARFIRDSWQRLPARVVIDPLDETGRRKSWKLPLKPYPCAATADANGLIHVLSPGPPGFRHSIWDQEGELVADHDVFFENVAGLVDSMNMIRNGEIGGISDWLFLDP